MYITPSGNVANNKVETHLEHKNLLEGIHFKFPTFKHDHPAVVNVNEVADERLTLGQKIADKVAAAMGSWRFIIIQASILAIWIVINTIQLFFKPFDPYPYILLNLALSFQAAFAAPFIMISQNRQAEKDRLMAESDYHCNVKGEEETRNLMDHLDHQDTVLFQLVKRIEEQHEEIMRHLARLDPEMASRLGVDIQEVSKELVEEETGDSNIAGNS
ncbi:MAG TPA: DUF1003 domain-containing protein [Ktedonobacteraceae bacterium]|nr:DUF1003 domain-containing protein [Ktedonobacteraceae bacterium]